VPEINAHLGLHTVPCSLFFEFFEESFISSAFDILLQKKTGQKRFSLLTRFFNLYRIFFSPITLYRLKKNGGSLSDFRAYKNKKRE
jgi:hypothetical protein